MYLLHAYLHWWSGLLHYLLPASLSTGQRIEMSVVLALAALIFVKLFQWRFGWSLTIVSIIFFPAVLFCWIVYAYSKLALEFFSSPCQCHGHDDCD